MTQNMGPVKAELSHEASKLPSLRCRRSQTSFILVEDINLKAGVGGGLDLQPCLSFCGFDLNLDFTEIKDEKTTI